MGRHVADEPRPGATGPVAGRLPETEDDEVGVSLDCPPGWIDLAVPDGEDPDAWALAQTRSMAPSDAPVERIEAAAASLADAVRLAMDAGPLTFLALAFQPDPLEPVLALWDVDLVPFEDGEALTLDDVEAILGSEGVTVGEAERDRRDLPSGPGLRLRRMREDQPTGEPDGGIRVTEGVTYVVLPPGLGGYAMLSGRWTAVVLGDELAARVDELAVRLSIIGSGNDG
ncbi:MAG: hypothetical protein GXX79_22320 [Actinomycetales bacterium]|nr:hypothetical protein [Actinomycetales bacterium]